MKKPRENVDRTQKEGEAPTRISGRRMAVVAGVLAGIGAVWWGAQKLFNEPERNGKDRVENVHKQAMSAEEFFRRFPDRIPGASKVETFPAVGAKHCLVHIRDQHDIDHILEHFEKEFFTPEFIANLSPEGKKTLAELRAAANKEIKDAARIAAEVDRDVQHILTHLVEHCGVDQVYLEGMHPSSEQAFSQYHAATEKGDAIKQELRAALLRLPLHAPERMNIQRSLDEILTAEKKSTVSLRKELRGAADLFLQKKIRVKSADDREVLELAMKAMIRGAPPEIQEKAKGYLREEKFLFKAVKNPFTVVRFGGAHTWRDNIEDWNRNIPQEQFSLIEITPTSFRENLK